MHKSAVFTEKIHPQINKLLSVALAEFFLIRISQLINKFRTEAGGFGPFYGSTMTMGRVTFGLF